MAEQNKNYYKTSEAAKLLGVAVSTVQLWANNGSLRSWTTNGGHRRIERSSVEEMLGKKKVSDIGLSLDQFANQAHTKKQYPHKNLVYLALSLGEQRLKKTLIENIKHAAYQVKSFTSVVDILEACNKELPTVIIIDMAFNDGDFIGLEAIKHLKNNIETSPALIFISEYTTPEYRLSAVRAGVDRYFYKPIAMNKFIHTLTSLKTIEKNNIMPYRILLIDDDVSSLNLYSTMLKSAGMEVEILSNPLNTLSALETFRPDVIITDVFMPECSGPELIQMIRQDDKWSLIPFVFFSNRKDIKSQMEAVQLGAESFLAKPTEKDMLVVEVSAVAKRARKNIQLSHNLKSALRENKYQLITLEKHALASTANVAGQITHVNHNFCETSGYSAEELLGQNHRILKSKRHPDSFYTDMWKVISSGEIWKGVICNKKKNDEEYWVESTIVPFLDEKGKPYKYVSIRTDITHLKNTEYKLVDAHNEAKASSHAKSQFLSSMSHELRTPMNAIIGFSQLLNMDIESPLNETQNGHVNEILTAGTHLMALINEVLDLSSIESGHIDMMIGDVLLGKIVTDSLHLIMPLAQKRDIDIYLKRNNVDISYEELLQEKIFIKADQSRFKQVLINLLSNAIKYNSDNGKVTLNCNYTNNEKVRISVTDTGSGLTEKQQAQLFMSFNRLGAEQSSVEGTGIGLVITKKIIELMGGSIGVECLLDKGCTFWVEIPIGLDNSTNTDIEQTDEVDSEKFDKEKHTILYIEDNKANMKLVYNLLQQIPNVELLEAYSPKLGIDLAIEHKPDLILLDINLPGMNGFEVFEKLQQHEVTSNIPIVAISANAMDSDISKALEAGFVDYIVKPIDVMTFLVTVNELLLK